MTAVPAAAGRRDKDAAMLEVPEASGVRVANVTTISLGGGKGTIAHPVNDVGAAARPGSTHQALSVHRGGPARL